MKNVCFFVGDISLSGGTERVSTVIANYISEHNYNVFILSLQNGINSFYPLSENIELSSIFSSPGRGLFRFSSTVLSLRNFLKSNNIDVIVCVESMLELYAIPATCGLNIRNICWEHFNYKIDLGKKTRRLARLLAVFFADDVITLTDKDRSFWMDVFFCRARISRIYNPVPFLVDNINVSKRKIVLAVGRLVSQKKFDDLIKSWSLVEQDVKKEWRLRIVGDGEQLEYLQKLSDVLNVSEEIEFFSSTRNIEEHYKQAAYYALTSEFEGFPMVLLEAQEYGLPIISVDCDTGPSEIIINNKSGWLVDPGNIELFSKHISYAMSIYCDEKYREMVCCSVSNAKKYHLTSIGRQWLELLND